MRVCLYLVCQDPLHRIRVVEYHKAEVGQLSSNALGVDAHLHHSTEACRREETTRVKTHKHTEWK